MPLARQSVGGLDRFLGGQFRGMVDVSLDTVDK